MKGFVAALLLLTSLQATADSIPVFGFCTHLGHGGRDAPRTLSTIEDLGGTTLRDEVLWSHVERDRGVLSLKSHHDFVDLAYRKGLKVLLVLGYGNDSYGPRTKPLQTGQLEGYLRYVQFVATTFRGRVWGYEIWNEYDGKAGGYPSGEAEDYARLVMEAVPVIRSADPTATIIVGSLTPASVSNGWLARFLSSVGNADFDGVSVHPYAQGRSERSLEVEYAVSLVNRVAIQLKNGQRTSTLGPVKVYVTEMGWQTASGYSSKEVGEKISRFVDVMRGSPDVGGVWLYELENSGRNERDGEHMYGFFNRGLLKRRIDNDPFSTHSFGMPKE